MTATQAGPERADARPQPATQALEQGFHRSESAGDSSHQPVTTAAGRIYILPSAQGWAFMLALFIMLLGAINYAAALAHALVFLLTGVLFAAPLHTQGNLLGLTIRLAAVPPVHAGQDARLAFVVTATGDRPRPGLELIARAHGRRRGRIPHEQRRRFAVPAGGSGARVEIAWPAGPRGRLNLPRIVLATRHPLGLFRAWTMLEPKAEALVWPAIRDLLPPPSAARAREGGAAGTHGPGAEEFRGLLAYRPGDPARRLAWRAWRPGTTPPVKHFGSGDDTRVFDWDDTAALKDQETRLSQLTAWVLAADRAAEDYGLRLPGQQFAAASGRAHREAVMAALALHGLPT